MKIIKYEKNKNGKYKIHLEDNSTISTYENVILKNNLLYKKDIQQDTYEKIIEDNEYEQAYLKCLNYIKIRLRSEFEINKYLSNKNYREEVIEETIKKLKRENLINEQRFAFAYVHDKFKFSTAGPYRITYELKQQKISEEIINMAIDTITTSQQEDKINKLIQKQIKSSKKTNYQLKNKIYTKLLNLGYSKDLILKNLNNYNF